MAIDGLGDVGRGRWKVDNNSRNDIIKAGRDKLNVGIMIDKFTPCLIENSTGKIVDTIMIQIKLKKQDYKGYNFDWSIPLRNGYEVYALKIVDDDTIQGLIAQKLESDNKTVHIDIVETAPHNYGSNGKYNGVGAHLFAHACKTAHDNDYSYVYFDAKTDLIDYYKEKLGAEQIGKSQRMLIEGEAFINLIHTYYGRS